MNTNERAYRYRPSADRLGEWFWYVGCDESDDEMMQADTRDEALRIGRDCYNIGESFYIVEARMRLSDEEAMGRGTRDTAPFAETRNGEWIEHAPDMDHDA